MNFSLKEFIIKILIKIKLINRIINICLLFICFSNLDCKLKIIGQIPKNSQLLDALVNKSLRREGFHNTWIHQIKNSLQNKKSNSDLEILSNFSKSDAYEILKPILKNDFDLTKEIIKSSFDDEIRPVSDSKKSDINYFKQEFVKRHLFETALKVHQTAKDNILLFIGQTPAYLGHMVKEINNLAKEKIDSIIFVPFSGRPDTILNRIKPGKKWNWTMDSYKEILTKSREIFFRNTLTSLGFSPFTNLYHKKVFILDNSEGPSIASLLTIICQWFNEVNSPLPDFNFICMDSFKKPLDMKMNDNLRFEIDTIYLNMEHQILNLNFDQIKDNLRIQPPFPAYLWRNGIEKYMKLYPKLEAKELLDIYSEFVKKNYNADQSIVGK